MQKPTDRPILTVLALDDSGSMSLDDYPPTRIGAACDASRGFLRESAAHGGAAHQAAIVTFDTSGRIMLPPTDVQRIDEFERVFKKLEGDGGTDFAAGLAEVRKVFDGGGGHQGRILGWLFGSSGSMAADPAVVRHVVFLSDGHTASKGAALRSATKLKDAGVTMETVGIGECPEDVDEKLLRGMASIDEGGLARYRFIGDREALLVEFQAKAARLKVV